ncbi:MAG: conjugal transfer protein TraG, partial [Bacteroidota bacterium]
RANELEDKFTYMSSLKDASPLAPVYGSYTNDNTGFVFQDRIHRKPLVVDLFDVKRKYIAAKNGMIITMTGEGKSTTLLNAVYQCLLYNIKLTCVEFGESFGFITKLFKDRAAHIKVKANMPMGINPFNLHGKECDPIKINMVTGFLLKAWRKNIELLNDQGAFYVALQKIVANYYKNVHANHNIETFYHYVLDNWERIKEAEKLKDKFLDIDEFQLFISQFIKGGIYDFVCMDNPEFNKQLIEADIVVYELTEIKKDPFLLSIVLAALLETINTNILSDRSQLGGVIMEEFAETSELKDMLGSGDVLSATAWIYQKIRKENGFIWTVLQNITQLPDNQYTDNIITNVQLLMTLGLSEKVADDVVAKFKIKNQDHINLMKSARKQFDTHPKWSELCIRWGESKCMVVRQELPLEKFLAFQTDGELWDWMNKDYEETHDMKETIENTIKHYGYEKRTFNNSVFIER